MYDPHDPITIHRERSALAVGVVFGIVLSLIVFGYLSWARRPAPGCVSHVMMPNPGDHVHCTPDQELLIEGSFVRCVCP